MYYMLVSQWETIFLLTYGSWLPELNYFILFNIISLDWCRYGTALARSSNSINPKLVVYLFYNTKGKDFKLQQKNVQNQLDKQLDNQLQIVESLQWKPLCKFFYVQ